MKYGRYLAAQRIPLSGPFVPKWIEAGERFDILGRIDDMVLVRYGGQCAWMTASALNGKALWSYKLPPEIVSADPPEGEGALTAEQIAAQQRLCALAFRVFESGISGVSHGE